MFYNQAGMDNKQTMSNTTYSMLTLSRDQTGNEMTKNTSVYQYI